jgi:hypothetical protein
MEEAQGEALVKYLRCGTSDLCLNSITTLHILQNVQL